MENMRNSRGTERELGILHCCQYTSDTPSFLFTTCQVALNNGSVQINNCPSKAKQMDQTGNVAGFFCLLTLNWSIISSNLLQRNLQHKLSDISVWYLKGLCVTRRYFITLKGALQRFGHNTLLLIYPEWDKMFDTICTICVSSGSVPISLVKVCQSEKSNNSEAVAFTHNIIPVWNTLLGIKSCFRRSYFVLHLPIPSTYTILCAPAVHTVWGSLYMAKRTRHIKEFKGIVHPNTKKIYFLTYL